MIRHVLYWIDVYTVHHIYIIHTLLHFAFSYVAKSFEFNVGDIKSYSSSSTCVCINTFSCVFFWLGKYSSIRKWKQNILSRKGVGLLVCKHKSVQPEETFLTKQCVFQFNKNGIEGVEIFLIQEKATLLCDICYYKWKDRWNQFSVLCLFFHWPVFLFFFETNHSILF